jgi:hypothetical protein
MVSKMRDGMNVTRLAGWTWKLESLGGNHNEQTSCGLVLLSGF